MKHIFEEENKLLSTNARFAEAAIIRHAGSSPRSTGTRMLVLPGGGIVGTIGGGLLEAEVIQNALQALAEGLPRVCSWNFNASKAGEMGMICGGRVEVLIQVFEPEDRSARLRVEELTGCVEERGQAWLATRLLGDPAASVTVVQRVLTRAADAESRSRELASLAEERASHQPAWVETAGETWLLEPIQSLASVIIFGAGHVSQQLATLTGWLGFRTVILDDRAEFANRERFPLADEIVLLPSFEEAFSRLEIGADSYLVIVTRGHANDLRVVEQALKTGARYIGMIGSRRKTILMFEALKESGFAQADLERVRAPIGLVIGAETPEEIAISIAGELIKARAGLL